MLTTLAEMNDYIEAIGVVIVNDNILTIKGMICYYFIPLGYISEDYYKDIQHNCYSNSFIDYIKIVPFYSKVDAITFDLFVAKTHLNQKIVNYLKKYQLHLYEVDIKTTSNNKNYDLINRISKTEIKIKIPSTVEYGNINFCICSAYQPDKIYWITSDGLYKEE